MSERILHQRTIGDIFLAHQEPEFFIRYPSVFITPVEEATTIDLRGAHTSFEFGSARSHERINSIVCGQQGFVSRPSEPTFALEIAEHSARERVRRLGLSGVIFDLVIGGVTLSGCVIENCQQINNIGEPERLRIEGKSLRLITDDIITIGNIPQSFTVKMNEIGEIQFDISL